MSEDMIVRYNAFSHEVAHDYRYSLSAESKSFLDEVVKQAKKYERTIPLGELLYRARANKTADNNEISTSPIEFGGMKPIPNIVSEGRVNAGNICALYLADNVGTALAEVRAGINHPVTVAKFSMAKDIKLVDISLRMGWWHYFYTPSSEDFWFALSRDFSRPVGTHNQHVHYAKTQIIAEHFKRNGFDGVCYRSQFIAHEKDGSTAAIEGKNYALFNLDDANPVSCDVYQVTQQRIVYDMVGAETPS